MTTTIDKHLPDHVFQPCFPIDGERKPFFYYFRFFMIDN